MRGFPGDWKLPLVRLPSPAALRPSFPCLPFQSSIPLSYLPSKTMGCFSGRLVSAASDQKLFCKLCSPFCCSFNEFVEEKVITRSYSSAILTPPPQLIFIYIHTHIYMEIFFIYLYLTLHFSSFFLFFLCLTIFVHFAFIAFLFQIWYLTLILFSSLCLSFVLNRWISFFVSFVHWVNLLYFIFVGLFDSAYECVLCMLF